MKSLRNKILVLGLQVVVLFCLTDCATPSIVATQSIRKGDEMNNQNRYDEAIQSYEEYLKVSPQLGVYRNTSMEAEVCRKLAHAYSTQGKYKQAQDRLSKALGIDSTVAANGLQVVEDYRQIGLVHAYSGNFQQALKNLEKTLVLNRGMERSAKSIKQSSIADTYLALAQVNLTLGNYKETNRYAHQAFLIYEKIPNAQVGMLESQLLIGIVARDKGDLKSAVRSIEASQKIAESQQLSTARHLQALGEVYFLQGELEEGIKYKNEALEQAEKTNIKPQIMVGLMRLGDAYRQLGDVAKANEFYDRALRLQTEISEAGTSAVPLLNLQPGNVRQAYDYYMRSGSSIGAGLVSLRLGEMKFSDSQMDSAQLLFTQAKTFFTKAENKEGVAKANIELAKVLTSKKVFLEAQRLLDEALAQTIQPDLKWQIHYRAGMVQEGSGKKDAARKLYEQSIAVIDEMRTNLTVDELKTIFANTKVDVYDQLILLLLENRNAWADMNAQQTVEKAFYLNEQARSRTFLDMLGNRKVDPKKTADTLLLNEEQLLRLKMLQLVQEINKAGENSESRMQLINELSNTQQVHRDILHKIQLSHSEYASMINVMPPSLQEVQSTLDNQTALVEYWVSDEKLIIWTISNKKIEAEIVPVTRVELLRQVSGARKGISLQVADVAQQSLTSLNKYLIQPIAGKLTSYKNVVIIPHRSLHFLPFQAITTSTGKFLIEQYILSYAPSAAVFYYCMKKVPESGKKFLGSALGDMSIGGHTGLPGTEIEVDQLSRLYGSFEKQSKEEFTETSFKDEIENYNYVHVATHGIFNKYQPLYSYLLMHASNTDDGRLTVNEIFALSLKSKMITLSACETALGDLGEADELVGLSRAFMYAGTPAIVVSLWKVDDATTAWLMTRFHQYVSGGYKGAEALTLAQRDLIQRNFSGTKVRGMVEVELRDEIKSTILSKTPATARNPYFWAPFILIGNGFIN